MINLPWQKLGQLYVPNGIRHPKLASHAANPLPIYLGGDVYRIYFSGRDFVNRSSIGAVDIDILERRVVAEHYEPFFQHGMVGSFYADGVSIGNCYEANNKTYMLFMGWQNPVDAHWRGDIGRLVVKDDLTLELDSEYPILGISEEDPLSLSYPWVTRNKDSTYSIWYGSTVDWTSINGEMVHVIKHAFSADGENWVTKGLAIPFEIGVAQAFSRPTVVSSVDRGYEMWFSYRSGIGERYRIGYAQSHNGLEWALNLAGAGINTSKAGWDSEMIEYPFVFHHKGELYMLYNGNGHGETGFGLAIRAHS